MDYNIIPILLLFCMLIIMLMGIMLPIGAKIVGEPVREIRLSFRERLLLHRVNVYAIGIVLLLTAATGIVPFFWELLVAIVVMMLLLLRARYLITNSGVAMNNVVFRPWSEFTGFVIDRRGVRLLPRAGLRPFTIKVIGQHKKEVVALLRRYLPASAGTQPSKESRNIFKINRSRKIIEISRPNNEGGLP
jgi:ammonium transporter, Amt family